MRILIGLKDIKDLNKIKSKKFENVFILNFFVLKIFKLYLHFNFYNYIFIYNIEILNTK